MSYIGDWGILIRVYNQKLIPLPEIIVEGMYIQNFNLVFKYILLLLTPVSSFQIR